MIEVHGLTKRYGPVVAVHDLEFSARPERVTALLGPNGAGKTTTLRILLGLARPDAGTATIAGHRYAELHAPLRTVGALVEGDTFHPARSGRAHLQVLATIGGLSDDRVDEVLRVVGLGAAADRRAGTYSQGMRRRLGLAGALLGDPRVLIADEPQGGLDPQGMRWLRRLLRSFADGGRTVLLSSHLLGEVAQIADDVVFIDRGRLVGCGALTDIVGTGDPAHAGRRLEEEFLRRTAGLAGEDRL